MNACNFMLTDEKGESWFLNASNTLDQAMKASEIYARNKFMESAEESGVYKFVLVDWETHYCAVLEYGFSVETSIQVYGQ